MISTEIRHLAEALQKRWPAYLVEVTASNYDTVLVVKVSRELDGEPWERRFSGPLTLDYKALSMEEWLHRFHTTMSERLP